MFGEWRDKKKKKINESEIKEGSNKHSFKDWKIPRIQGFGNPITFLNESVNLFMHACIPLYMNYTRIHRWFLASQVISGDTFWLSQQRKYY